MVSLGWNATDTRRATVPSTCRQPSCRFGHDSEGHAAGDRLIRLAAATLDRSIRGRDQLFRIGGDEFVVLATESTPPGTDVLFRRLRAALDDAGVQASIGSATRTSADGTLIEAFSDADHDMYRDKVAREAQR